MWCLVGGKSFPLSVLLLWLLLSAPAVQVAAFSRPQHQQHGFTGVGAQGGQGRLFQYQHIALAPSVLSPIATARRRSCIASAPDNNNHIPEEIKDRVMKALDGKEDLSVVSYVADFYKDSFVKKRIGALEDTVQQLVQRIQALEAKAATNQQLKPARSNQRQPRYQHLRLRPQQQQQQHQQQQQQRQEPQAEQTQQTQHTQQARNAWQEYLRSTLGTVPPQPRSQPPQPQQPQTQQITPQQNRFDEYAATSVDNMGGSTSSQSDVDYSDEYSDNYGDEYEGEYEYEDEDEDEDEDDSEDEDSDEEDAYSIENNRQHDATYDSATTRQRQSQQSPSDSTERRGGEEWAPSSRWPFTEFRNFFNRIVYL